MRPRWSTILRARSAKFSVGQCLAEPKAPPGLRQRTPSAVQARIVLLPEPGQLSLVVRQDGRLGPAVGHVASQLPGQTQIFVENRVRHRPAAWEPVRRSAESRGRRGRSRRGAWPPTARRSRHCAASSETGPPGRTAPVSVSGETVRPRPSRLWPCGSCTIVRSTRSSPASTSATYGRRTATISARVNLFRNARKAGVAITASPIQFGRKRAIFIPPSDQAAFVPRTCSSTSVVEIPGTSPSAFDLSAVRFDQLAADDLVRRIACRL